MSKMSLHVACGLSHNDGDGGCSFLAAYRRANGSSPLAWSKGRRPSGTVLHSSRNQVYSALLLPYLWIRETWLVYTKDHVELVPGVKTLFYCA